MTREEAIKILKAIRVYECYPKSASEETKEAIDMAIEALNVKEHDGCDGCRYEANDEYMMPCANCRQMPQEQNWISCSERLPETPKHYYERKPYLICTNCSRDCANKECKLNKKNIHKPKELDWMPVAYRDFKDCKAWKGGEDK